MVLKHDSKSYDVFYVVRDSHEQLVALIYTKQHLSAICQQTSSETQGQLVGATGFSWAKVYNKSGGAPGHLLLPIQFQKRLNSLLLIFSGQSTKRNSRATLMSSYTRLFSSSIAVVAWPVQCAYYLGMTFINRGRIALLESRFHFQIEYCNVPTIALFQIRNADWFIIDIWQMFTCNISRLLAA